MTGFKNDTKMSGFSNLKQSKGEPAIREAMHEETLSPKGKDSGKVTFKGSKGVTKSISPTGSIGSSVSSSRAARPNKKQ